MNAKQLKQAIRKARYVFANVSITEHDTAYLQVQKQSILLVLRKADGSIEYLANMRDRDLYIGGY